MKKPIILVSICDIKDINIIPSDGYVLGYEKYTFFAPNYFSYQDIKNVKTDKKIFIILNALLHENDIDGFKNEVIKLKELGFGFIVQDLGALSILIDNNVDLDKIIFNPYTHICNLNDFKAYKNAFNVTLGLSTQLSAEEIRNIIKKEEKAFIEIYGYEPIYQSYRKVISLYEEARNISFKKEKLSIREDTRDELYPILENKYGSVIFNYKKVNLVKDKGSLSEAKYFYIDGTDSSKEEINEVIKGLKDE